MNFLQNEGKKISYRSYFRHCYTTYITGSTTYVCAEEQASCWWWGVVPHNMARWVVGKVCLPTTGEMKLRLMTAVANAYYDKDYISFG